MVDREVIAATEAQWYQARARMKQLGTQSAIQAVSLITVISVPASYLARLFFTGLLAALVTAAGMLFAALPLTGLVWYRMDHQQRLSNRLMKTLRTQLKNAIDEVENESGRRHVQVRRQDFERSLHSALEMAGDEPEVIDVIERALATVLPDSAAELLLADNSHAHLIRVATSSPAGKAPGCSVGSPDDCPAARRSQVQRFADSDALDACPKLRGRTPDRFSALCVPVSIMGRTVGVLHAVDQLDSAPSVEQGQDLAILADKVGARIGLLRVIAESQLQASTDSLTGLLNRRSMQNKSASCARPTSSSRWWLPTWTISRNSTTPTATRPATGRCDCSPPPSPARCAGRTCSRGTAARSSWRCCPAARVRTRAPRWTTSGPGWPRPPASMACPPSPAASG